jgi:hypothetical protein
VWEEGAWVAQGKRLAPVVSTQEKMAKVPNLEGSVPMGSSALPTRDGPAQVEVVTADVLPHIYSSRVNEVIPQSVNAPGGKALAPGPPMGPGFRPPEDPTLGDMVSTPRS